MRIDLRENDIKTGGLMALSLSLNVSKTVTMVDLDKDPKKENVCKTKSGLQRGVVFLQFNLFHIYYLFFVYPCKLVTCNHFIIV